MTDKKQIIIDGIDVSGCKSLDGWKHCNCCNDLIKTIYPKATKCHVEKDLRCETYPNCYFKQLARKTQECEELEKELVRCSKGLGKAACEKSWYQQAEQAKQEENHSLAMEIYSYRKALEEIEKIAKDGLNPICYKSNCSRCKCYNGDDCKAGMISLINNYFTENGEFADGNGDFAEALEDLLDKERSRCNRALPISKKILDIINKAKGEGNE